MRRTWLPLAVIAAIIVAMVTAAYVGRETTDQPEPAQTQKARPEGAPAAAWTTVEVFTAAWQSTDPDVREAGFRATAIDTLGDGLMTTAPENIVTDQRQSVAVAGGSAYAYAFDITFATHPDVRVMLVADPAGEYDWRVTEIALKG